MNRPVQRTGHDAYTTESLYTTDQRFLGSAGYSFGMRFAAELGNCRLDQRTPDRGFFGGISGFGDAVQNRS